MPRQRIGETPIFKTIKENSTVNKYNTDDEFLLKPGVKVITSKGRFGEIISIDDKQVCLVKIGSNEIKIYIKELIHIQNVKCYECEYLIDNVEAKEIVYSKSKKLVIYNENDTFANEAYDIVKEQLSNKYKDKKILIKSINLI